MRLLSSVEVNEQEAALSTLWPSDSLGINPLRLRVHAKHPTIVIFYPCLL
jgi:hypothetical protein